MSEPAPAGVAAPTAPAAGDAATSGGTGGPGIEPGAGQAQHAPASSKTREEFDLGTHAGLDDDALATKMRQAQERLEGLDKHVADLKRRSEEQDAISKVRREASVRGGKRGGSTAGGEGMWVHTSNACRREDWQKVVGKS
jgi:hypothetical protein